MFAQLRTVVFLSCLGVLPFASGEPFREITFNPPGAVGDFGDPANWSDPTAVPPVNPPLAPIASYGNTWYHINNFKTAEINAGSPFGSHFSLWHLFPGDSPHFMPGTATPSGIPPSMGRLVMNGGVAPAPDEFGASLTVLGTNRFILGQRANMGGTMHAFDPSTGDGEVILNGSSDLLADGIVVGERDRGYMFIGPDARVRSGRLNDEGNLSRQDFRIGSFGPSRGLTEPIHVLLEGDGLVVVQGTLQASTIIMPESGATGELRLEGGDIDVRGLLLNFQLNQSSRSSKVSIVGSQGSFNLFAGDLLANDSSVTFAYSADAGGVVPIVGQAGADIEGAQLDLDLDGLQFTPETKVTLIDVLPDLLFGEFGSVNFIGNTTASITYDTLNGDVFLDNFQRASAPLAGDFNENGLVTGADLAAWEDGFGTLSAATHMQGDADDDNDVDGADFLVWQRQLGMAQASAVAAAIPEPQSVIMLALGCLLVAARRR